MLRSLDLEPANEGLPDLLEQVWDRIIREFLPPYEMDGRDGEPLGDLAMSSIWAMLLSEKPTVANIGKVAISTILLIELLQRCWCRSSSAIWHDVKFRPIQDVIDAITIFLHHPTEGLLEDAPMLLLIQHLEEDGHRMH